MWRRWRTHLVTAFLGCGLVAGCVARTASQAPDNGVFARLVDADGTPLPGVEVRVFDKSGLQQVVLSDSRGNFELRYLLSETGERIRLRRGQKLHMSAWRLGLVPWELSLLYPGGRVVLEPVVMEEDTLEIESEGIPGLGEDRAGGRPFAGTGQSRRGE